MAICVNRYYLVTFWLIIWLLPWSGMQGCLAAAGWQPVASGPGIGLIYNTDHNDSNNMNNNMQK